MSSLASGAAGSADPATLFSPLLQYRSIGLAVSGGPDSLALMLLAVRWLRKLDAPRQVIVYTVDHGLRPEAAEEARMVVREAERLGLEARLLRWEAEKPSTGIQQAARTARYRLIGKAMREDRVEILVTAHHLDDQAETVLMRLAHGSGLEGLRGMEPLSRVEDVPILRPLLGISRATLRQVVEHARLVPAADPSNDDDYYERVRWRQILPALAELGLDTETIGRFAARVGEADAALAEFAEAAFDELVVLDGFGTARIGRAAFAALSAAVATRVLRRVLNIAGGRQKPRALGQIERLRDSLRSDEPVLATTVLGSIVRMTADAIVVMREPGRLAIPRHTLQPHSEVVWDDRFLIANQSTDTGLSVGFAAHLDRRRLSEFLGFKVTAPAEAIRTAPVVRDGAGNILALGGWSFDERIGVRLLVD